MLLQNDRLRRLAAMTLIAAAATILASLPSNSAAQTRQFAGRDASSLTAVYGRGVHAYFANRHNEAERLLTQVAQAGSRDPRVYYFRAMTRYAMGRSYEAKQDMQIGAALEARNPGSGRSIGRALVRVQGQHRRLLEQYRRDARVQLAQQNLRKSPSPDGQAGNAHSAATGERRVLRRPVQVPLEQLMEPSLSVVAPSATTSPGVTEEQPTPAETDPPIAATPQPAVIEPQTTPAPSIESEDPFGDATSAENAVPPSTEESAPATVVETDPFSAATESTDETEPTAAAESIRSAQPSVAEPAVEQPAGDDDDDPFGGAEPTEPEPAAPDLAAPDIDEREAEPPAPVAAEPRAEPDDPFGGTEERPTGETSAVPGEDPFGAATDSVPVEESGDEVEPVAEPTDADPFGGTPEPAADDHPADDISGDPFGTDEAEMPEPAADEPDEDAAPAEDPFGAPAESSDDLPDASPLASDETTPPELPEEPASSAPAPGTGEARKFLGILGRVAGSVIPKMSAPKLPDMPPIGPPAAAESGPGPEAFDLGPGEFGEIPAEDIPEPQLPGEGENEAEMPEPSDTSVEATPSDTAGEDDPFGGGEDPFGGFTADEEPESQEPESSNAADEADDEETAHEDAADGAENEADATEDADSSDADDSEEELEDDPFGGLGEF